MSRIKETLCCLAVIAALLTLRSPASAQPLRFPPDSISLGEVHGIHPNLEEAENDAVEAACKEVKLYLVRTHSGLCWTPDPAYLRKSSIVHSREWTKRDLATTGPVIEVTYRVTLTPAQLQEIESFDRHQRVQDRHRWLGLLLAGVAAGLVVLKLYLWLEELTRGYSTNLLRAAALVILGLVIAVLIWLW
jgi:hypothetical protein